MRRLIESGVAVGIGGAIANGLAYLVPLLAARHLAPDQFSTLVTVLAICTIATVASQGLQVATAVRVARGGSAAPSAMGTRTAAATVVVFLAVSPLLVWTLRLPWTTVLLTVALTAPIVWAGGYLGVLQGTQQFSRLATGMALLGVGRSGALAVALGLGLSVPASLSAGVFGALAAAVLIRTLVTQAPTGTSTSVREVMIASGATLAMLTISYADLLLARHVLPVEQAADYAALNILTKGAIWAPQLITVLALPRLAKRSRRALSYSIGANAMVGLLLVSATVVAGEFAMRLAGGTAYVHLADKAPIFAAAGSLFALLFLLVNVQLAEGAKTPSAPVWIATVGFGLAVLLWPQPDINMVITGALITAALTVVVVGSLIARRRWAVSGVSQSTIHMASSPHG